MDEHFSKLVETLAPKLAALLAMTPITDGRLPRDMPSSGIYLFSEAGKHLYVGRSNKLRRRYGLHTLPGSQQNQASFAYRLACESMEQRPALYRIGSGRRAYSQLPEFIEKFAAAKARVRKMEFRFVEQTNQTYQAVLEIYAAVVLNTPYNDFSNH
ncbi:hypothetical protein KQX63_19540 [Rhodopseudomonas palustris]|uniref:hypothetical protein n=1 Tax=Rhodopseudomonas palustris TaxID=1076 RepID=UPI0021F2D4F9|nr:hypothetical protein [Rhodopseudomonas palustris]UYO43556.1 hypothetical protein KQX63_19540 [Rhodopseudomonas palustris]